MRDEIKYGTYSDMCLLCNQIFRFISLATLRLFLLLMFDIFIVMFLGEYLFMLIFYLMIYQVNLDVQIFLQIFSAIISLNKLSALISLLSFGNYNN